jgi:hypothetical protein
MEGTNDVGSRDSRVLPQTIANLRNMLVQAMNRDVVPYLATVPPMVPITRCEPSHGRSPIKMRLPEGGEGFALGDIEAPR